MRLIPLDKYQNILKQVGDILDTAGQTVTWRSYVGLIPGRPEIGLGDQPTFNEITIQVLIDLPTEPESQLDGGQVIQGRIMVQSKSHFTAEDEIVWNGVRYRVDSEVVSNTLGGTVFWTCAMTRVF